MTDVSPGHVRVRMAPSPTGSPHVGLARTALYNWAFARHHGGTFVFRIEDTDAARNTQESYDGLFEVMHWLGLSWDEGPDVGGPFAPYRQSERADIYLDVLERLRGTSRTYDCYCTNEEVEARRKASGSKVMGYDGFCRDLSADQVAAFEAEDRRPVVRFRMPDGEITFDDLVRGPVTFHTDHVPDFALARANGDPLYTLVNPVADGPTLVLSGDFDVRSTWEVRTALHSHLREHDEDVVVDLTHVYAVDLTALKVLAYATREASRSGHHLTLRGCGPSVRRMLYISRLIRVVEVERHAASA